MASGRRHLRLASPGPWRLTTHPSARAEVMALVTGADQDRATQLRTLLGRVLQHGRALEGVDVKPVRRQPDIYELVFDHRGQRWRPYLADPPGSERLVMLCMAARKPGGRTGLSVQDGHVDEAAARYHQWLHDGGAPPPSR